MRWMTKVADVPTKCRVCSMRAGLTLFLKKKYIYIYILLDIQTLFSKI
jgi:hypothetical protein